jgi:hypothetical protein
MTVAEAKYDVVLQDRRRQKAIQRFIKRQSVAITAGIMVLIGVILLFLHLPALNPPLEVIQEEEGFNGVTIIGNDEVGMNETFELVAAGPKDVAKSEDQSSVADPTMTEDDPEAPNIGPIPPNPQATKVVPKPNPTNTTVPEDPKPKVDENSLFTKSDKPKGGGGTGGNNNSKGTGTTPGDQGSKTGSDKGTRWELENGSISYVPQPRDNSQVFGRLVVNIIVNKDGVVVSATGGATGSTITNEATIDMYERELIGKKIATPSPDGPDRRNGKITYNQRANS